MPIGNNIGLKDKLIKKTTGKASIASNTSKTSITIKGSRKSITCEPGKKKKMAFYVKEDLLQKLYNFAYWDRRSVTEAFNLVLEQGLRGKNTKPKP